MLAQGKAGTEMRVDITVNGTPESHDVEARTLLVYYLRDAVGLKGTNVGCDTTSCGACTVLVERRVSEVVHRVGRSG